MNSNSDDEVDDRIHKQLLDDIKELDNPESLKRRPKLALKKTKHKVNVDDLIGSIKSTKNVLDLKKKLSIKEVEEEPTDVLQNYKQKLKTAKKNKAKNKVLNAPLHRQAKQRIESQVVYQDVRSDLHEWNPIVHKNRVAEQIHFPLNAEKSNSFHYVTTAADIARDFVPKTELEKLTAQILGKSKFNITNEDEFCEAEKELIQSMSLKQSREKVEELKKIRALVSYKAIRAQYQSKIKSKQYHRIKKREERRKLMKEVEDLLVKDPDAAKEKIKGLEKDRAYERASLKHRGLNQWSKEMRKFGSRNVAVRKMLDEHLRLGSELKGRNHLDAAADEDDSDVEAPKKKVRIGDIVDKAAEEAAKDEEPKQIISSENPFLKSALEAIRKERQEMLEKARVAAEQRKDGVQKPNAGEEKRLDKNKLIELEARNGVTLPEDLVKGRNEYDTELRENFMAEAYGDDDVLADFKEIKGRVEEEEEPKVIDMNLAGWGAWTGPGIVDKKYEKFIVCPKKLKRRDAEKPNVIIRERLSKAVAQLQPRDVPFPFTCVEDYETYVKQPLGREWNSEISRHNLTRPRIVTEAGRIIQPLDKAEKLRFQEDSD